MSPINILSWNICFGCMLANEKSSGDVTAKVIAEYCRDAAAAEKAHSSTSAAPAEKAQSSKAAAEKAHSKPPSGKAAPPKPTPAAGKPQSSKPPARKAQLTSCDVEESHASDTAEKPHECLKNVINFICKGIQVKGKICEPYDLIGLQEVVETINWDHLISTRSKLQNMSYVFNTVKFQVKGQTQSLDASMITLYNKEKFTLLAACVGNLSEDAKDGRPYQILYLKKKDEVAGDKKTQLKGEDEHGIKIQESNFFLVINLHNGKFNDFHKDKLEDKFSKIISNKCNYVNKQESDTPIKIKLVAHEEKSLVDVIGDNIPHVICMGDFNDGPYQYEQYIEMKRSAKEKAKANPVLPYSDRKTRGDFFEEYKKSKSEWEGLENYWKGLQLFKSVSNKNLKDITVSSQVFIPPNTCCTGKELRSGDKEGIFLMPDGKEFNIDSIDDGYKDVGDYIIISKDLKYVKPMQAHWVANSSDHKPVTCRIDEPHSLFVTAIDKRNDKDFNKYLKYKIKYLKLKELINTY